MTDKMNSSINLLGYRVCDKITEFEGVVVSVAFDLPGCIQAGVSAKNTSTGETTTSWFDVKRLKVLSDSPIMEQPDFVNVPGGVDKAGYGAR